MSYSGYELQAKRLEMFKEVVPSLRRVAVLYNARGEPIGLTIPPSVLLRADEVIR